MASLAATVAETLLSQFLTYAQLSVDRGEAPQDASYEKALQGLQVAAAQAGPIVVDRVLAWREGSLRGAKAERSELYSKKKMLVTDAVVLEALVFLAQADLSLLPSDKLPKLEFLALDWMLEQASYVDARFADLAQLKDRVLSVVSELLGTISVLRLGSITERFLEEMGRRIRADYASAARNQLDWMLQGMRLLQLRGDTNEQLRASKAFLEKAHPLRHEAKDKKSRLQQAICDMLTSVLQQLLEREDPSLFGAECDSALRKLWFAQVHTLRVDLLKWVNKQSKQVLSGLPTIAMLACIEEQQSHLSAVEGVIELLHKQLKDRRNASMAVQCLTWCVGSFLRRCGQRIPRDKLSGWTSWAVAPVIQGMTRGGLAAPEQQELVRALCAVVAPYLPELALTKMVCELMAPPGQEGGSTNWDAPMAGATALLSILAAAPARLAAAAAAGVDVSQPPSPQLGWEPPLAAAAQGGRLEKGVWLPSGESMQDLLNLVQAGYSPLQAYGVAQLGPRVSQALSSLLKECHRIYGVVRLISPASRAASEALARERTLSVLPVFVMALQCVPFIMPDHWVEGKVFEDLLLYTVHIEQPMRQVSYRVLHRIMVSMPHLRDQLVGSMATFIARVQEEYLEVIRDRLGELLSLMQEWGDIVAAERAAGLGPADTPTSPTVGCLHRVEGAGLTLLCSNDVEVRRLGVDLLRSVRDLHRSLVARQPGSSRRSTAEPLQFRPGTAGSGGGAAAAQQRRISQQSSGGDVSSLPSTPGGGGGLGEYHSRTVYVADVLDRSGIAAAQRCYWDFNRWSDIWRAWRPLPPTGATFEQCMMRTFSNDDNVRWARLLCEVMKEVWRRCEASAGAAHNEMAIKLQHLLTPDSSGRYVLPTDSTADPRLDVARNYCLALAAAPLMEASHSERLTAASTREMARMLVSNARSGTEAQQQVSVLALGNAHHSCHGVVVSEAAEMVNDYGDRSAQRSLSMGVPMVGASRSSKARKDDLRLTHANILRVLADNLPAGALVKSNVVCDRLTEWVRDTYRHITSVTELSVEQQQLRHCLACVARHCSLQLAEAQPQSFTQQQRKQLFDMFSLWCEEGRPGGTFRNEQRRTIQALKLRMKDIDAGRQLETELADISDVLEHAAYLGMAAMLNGPLFTADVRNPEGQVFSWADRMLYSGRNGGEAPASRAASWGPPKAAVARSGLRYLLQSNPSLASIFVDRSYARNQVIAAGYFQVLAEVYASQELPVAAEVLVSLMVHKVVDSRQEVRDAARGLLSVLSRRQWGRETRYSEHDASLEVQVPESGSLVVGILHDSQQSHQLRLSARLARDHPELAEQVALEVLARQLDNDTGPEALLCLCPWLAHITLDLHWEGQQAERLLQLLYRITASQGQRHSYQVQKLWATLGGTKRNVEPILDFLIDRGLKECATDQSETPCAVGKAVALYLSRVVPNSTIDHLVQEVAQQLSEVDGVRQAETPQATTPKILEFHHSPQGAVAWHSSVVVSASGGSRPTTPMGTPAIKAGGAGGTGVLLKTQSAWSESSFTSSAERGPHGGGEGAAKGDAHSPPLSRRNSDIKMPTLERRGVLTRPELALCLLTELAYEHDEEFRRHLPTLLQVVTLNADSPNVTVRQECAQLLTYLLYSLACKHLEAQVAAGSNSPEYQRVAKLIGRLRTLRGQPLWAREQPTLANPYVDSAADVTSFVQTVVDCFYFDTALRERWCAESLMWACAAHSRHFASRSHQVFCALSPALSSTSCTAMLSAMVKCLQSTTTAQSLDTAVEVLCTLHTLLDNLAGSKVLLYPQLLLAAVALLNSSVVRVGELAMQILLQVLSQLDLGDPTVQHAVLALLPVREGEEAGASNENSPLHNRLPSPPTPQDSGTSADAMVVAAAQLWPLGQGLLGGVQDVPEDLGPWMALPQLVVKALFQPDTQLLALEVLAAIARQVGQAPLGSGQCMVGSANGFPQALGGLFSSLSLADSLVGSDGMFGDAVCGVESVLGDAEVGIAVSLGAALPWLWVHLTESATADTAATFLEGMSSACASVGWRDLSAVLAALAGMAGLDAEPPGLLMPLCQAMCVAMFPAYTRLVAQRLVEVVQRGAEPYQAAAVAVLKVIFEVSGADLGEVSWFARDSKIIATLSAHVDTPLGPQVLDLFQAMMRLSGSPAADRQQQSARETLEWPRCMDDLGDSNKLCTEALARVLDACPDAGLQPVLAMGASGVDMHLLPFLHG